MDRARTAEVRYCTGLGGWRRGGREEGGGRWRGWSCPPVSESILPVVLLGPLRHQRHHTVHLQVGAHSHWGEAYPDIILGTLVEELEDGRSAAHRLQGCGGPGAGHLHGDRVLLVDRGHLAGPRLD